MIDSTSDGVTFRLAGADDDEAIRRVNAEAFPHNPKARADITAWQYWTNPFGPSFAAVAEIDGEIVAQHVAYPMPAQFGSETGRIVNGVDLGVLDAHRGRGLAREVTRRVYDACTAAGMPVYAFASNNSVRVLSQCGWVDVSRMEILVLPTHADAIAGRVPLPAALGGLLGRASLGLVARRGRPARPDDVDVAVARPDTIPEDLEGLWAAESEHHRWGVVRDAPWWRWRYGGHPDHPYEVLTARRNGRLVGAGVIGTRDDIGGTFRCLYELLAVDEMAARSLVSALRDGARAVDAPPPDSEIDGVAVAGNPNTRITALARAAGLVRVPPCLLPTPLRFGVVPDPSHAPRPADHVWSTAWGDNDHI